MNDKYNRIYYVQVQQFSCRILFQILSYVLD